LEGAVNKDRAVGAEYPLFTKYTHQTNFLPAIEQLITGKPYPIKALIVAGGNPLVTWAHTHKVIEGFRKLDFMVVIDVFMTDTAKMADIVLPGSTFLERADLRNYFQHYGDTSLVLTNKVVDPIGNSMEDWKIWAELGRKMGYGEYFPWKDNDELVEDLLEPLDVSLRELKQNPGGVRYADREYRQYLTEGFNTPSGKVEIYSETMKEFGYDPLPTFNELKESDLGRPDLAEQYPLMLISFRENAYTHSQYRNLPSQRKRVPEPLLQINPQTARDFGVADGDMVEVESSGGSIRIRAHVTEDIAPDLLGVPMGWAGEANVNCLTDDMDRDPVSGYPTFKPMCRVRKV
jgi:anaerobic selenocysteine-containing dehydrogenase